MEQIKTTNVTKPAKKMSQAATVRIKNSTKKKLTSLLNKVNKKDFGKRVKASELIEVALGLLTELHLKSLAQDSLSNSDRLELQYKDYIKKKGHVSKDEFYGILLKNMEQDCA